MKAIKDFCDRHALSDKFTPNQKRDLGRRVGFEKLTRTSIITEWEAKNLLPIFDEISALDFSFHEHGIDESLR